MRRLLIVLGVGLALAGCDQYKSEAQVAKETCGVRGVLSVDEDHNRFECK